MGLIPGWSKKLDKFSPLINARRETLMEKVTFRILSRHQGVLFQLMAIMSGREDKTKIPYYFTKENDEIMYLQEYIKIISSV